MSFDTHRRNGNVTTQAKIGVIWLRASQCWQPPEAGRGKDKLSPGASIGAWPWQHLDFSSVILTLGLASRTVKK